MPFCVSLFFLATCDTFICSLSIVKLMTKIYILIMFLPIAACNDLFEGNDGCIGKTDTLFCDRDAGTCERK